MKTFVVSMLLLSPAALSAQVGERRADLAIGVNGGVALNQVSFNPTVKQTLHRGATMGVTVRYTCEKYFSSICAVQAELNYARLGWEEVIETSSDTYRRDVDFLQLPIFARMAWGREQRGFQFFVMAGPEFDFYLGDSDQRGGEWSSATLAERPNNITAQYDLPIQNKLEYGITGGAGLELSTAIGHFQLEGRYCFSLSDMFNNGKKDAFGRSANGAIIIKAAYLIDLMKTK
ncbi:MAG: PorT family protein [Bacteroidaceae bacterium]|nr:PorT family protein [Bacteroidaceae bacterium]